MIIPYPQPSVYSSCVRSTIPPVETANSSATGSSFLMMAPTAPGSPAVVAPSTILLGLIRLPALPPTVWAARIGALLSPTRFAVVV